MNVHKVALSLESNIFPHVYKRKAEEYQSETHQLPNTYPLSRRLSSFSNTRFADFKWRDQFKKVDKRFTYGVYSIDKFRDIPPSLIVKLHSSHVSFEAPQNEGVLGPSVYPLNNDAVSLFLERFLDGQTLPADLMKLFDEMQCVFYDGCLVVELHDYRKTPAAHQKSPVPPAVPLTDAAATSQMPQFHLGNQPFPLSAQRKQKSQPEMRRILLKPSYETLLADTSFLAQSHQLTPEQELALEQQLLLATSKPICLNPSPGVCKILNYYSFNGKKYFNRGSTKLPTQRRDFVAKFDLLNMVEEIRRRKALVDAEPLLGLDKKGSATKGCWSIPLQKIYRTLRFEKESNDGARTFISVNAIAQGNNSYEVVFRIGVTPDTSLRGETLRFTFANRQILLDRIADQSIRCVADVTNSAIASAARLGMPPNAAAMKPGSAMGSLPAKKMPMQQAAAQPHLPAALSSSRMPFRPPSAQHPNPTSPVMPHAPYSRPPLSIQMTVSDGQKSRRLELNPHSAAKINPLHTAQHYRQLKQPQGFMGSSQIAQGPIGMQTAHSSSFQGIPYGAEGSLAMQEQMAAMMAHPMQNRHPVGPTAQHQAQYPTGVPNHLIQHARSIITQSDASILGSTPLGLSVEQPQGYSPSSAQQSKSNIKNTPRKSK